MRSNTRMGVEPDHPVVGLAVAEDLDAGAVLHDDGRLGERERRRERDEVGAGVHDRQHVARRQLRQPPVLVEQIGPARRYGVVAGSPGEVTDTSWWYSLVTGSATLMPASRIAWGSGPSLMSTTLVSSSWVSPVRARPGSSTRRGGG